MPASWCWLLHHIHPWKTLSKECAFRGYSTGWGRRVCLRQSGAVHRGVVGQPSSSSIAQAIMSLPPTNLIISRHLKRVQFNILMWKAADQIFSNSPGKPTTSVFSALMFCPCRQCRTLRRSGWIVCVGSKAAVSIICACCIIGQYRPPSPSGWRDHPVDHSAMSSRPATRIYPCHHRGP